MYNNFIFIFLRKLKKELILQADGDNNLNEKLGKQETFIWKFNKNQEHLIFKV